MSPYRVLIEYILDGKVNNRVLSAMLSVDKVTGNRNVYVLDKISADIKDGDYISPKFIAHTQSGRRNSSILAKFKIDKNDDRSYSVSRSYYSTSSDSAVYLETNIREFTQSDCLRAIMHHFCASNNYKIVQDL